jgi:hypothetical protein
MILHRHRHFICARPITDDGNGPSSGTPFNSFLKNRFEPDDSNLIERGRTREIPATARGKENYLKLGQSRAAVVTVSSDGRLGLTISRERESPIRGLSRPDPHSQRGDEQRRRKPPPTSNATPIGSVNGHLNVLFATAVSIEISHAVPSMNPFRRGCHTDAVRGIRRSRMGHSRHRGNFPSPLNCSCGETWEIPGQFSIWYGVHGPREFGTQLLFILKSRFLSPSIQEPVIEPSTSLPCSESSCRH